MWPVVRVRACGGDGRKVRVCVRVCERWQECPSFCVGACAGFLLGRMDGGAPVQKKFFCSHKGGMEEERERNDGANPCVQTCQPASAETRS